MKSCLPLSDTGAVPVSSTKRIVNGYVFRGREIDFDGGDEGVMDYTSRCGSR